MKNKSIQDLDIKIFDILLNKIISSKTDSIRIHINTRLKLIECNDTNLKEILNIFLKSGMLNEIKKNIEKIPINYADKKENIRELKIIISNKKFYITLKEKKQEQDFLWEIKKNYSIIDLTNEP